MEIFRQMQCSKRPHETSSAPILRPRTLALPAFLPAVVDRAKPAIFTFVFVPVALTARADCLSISYA